MDTVKKISDLDPHDVPIVERLFDRPLAEAENVVLILRDENQPADAPDCKSDAPQGEFVAQDTLPDWCDMYAGLSDAEIADLESVVLMRANLSRSLG